MNKYWRTFLISLQNQMMYRANLFFWFVVGIIPSLLMIIVWTNIAGNNKVSGYSRGDFVTYYLFMTFSWYIVGGTFCRWLGDWIKNGMVNRTLTKPYSILAQAAIIEQAWKASSLVVSLPAFILLYVVYGKDIHLSLDLLQITCLLVSLILGALIYIFMETVAGMMTFWADEVWPFAHLVDIGGILFGGRLAPLPLMPAVIQNTASLLPFKYEFFIPLNIMLGKSANPAFDVLLQAGVTIILYLITRIIWNRGIKRYEGFGG